MSSSAPSSAPTKTAPSSRARLFTVLRWLVAAAIAASIVFAIAELWPDVKSTIASLSVATILWSFAAAVAGMAANVMAWHAILRELDHKLTVVESGRIYLVGGLGKYLPGSVWAILVQMELALRAGVPRARSFAASLVLIGLSTTVALVVGVFGVPALVDTVGAAAWGLVVLVPVALVCAFPPVLSKLVDLMLRLLRRPGIAHPFSYRGVATVMGWCLLAWVMFGTHLAILAAGAGQVGITGWAEAVGAFALAMTAGLFAFLAPSGLGVREGVLVAALAPFVGAGSALGIALASRLIFTVADVMAAGAAALSARRVLAAEHAAEAAAPVPSTGTP